MKTFSLSPALIAALLAGTPTVCLAQTYPGNVRGVSPLAEKGGSNIGGSEDGISIYSVNPWNTGILRTIKRTKQSATDNFADNKLETAIKIYELQLEKISATASIPELQLSWTKKIADRTLDLASRLEVSIKNQDDRIALFNVYATTYDLIEEFYTKLDLAYIIPYRKNCKNKDFKLDLTGYEYQLNQYILKQGEWFNQRFVAGSNTYGTLPKYSPTIFLIALSALSKGLAQDLLTDSVTGPNLFPHQYESIASLLVSISEGIDEHLAGGSVFSGRDDRAINSSYRNFLEVMASVKTN